MNRFRLFLVMMIASAALDAKNSSVQQTSSDLLQVVWQKIYGGKNDDSAQGVVALEGGDSAIVGTCKSYGAKGSDICVVRMDRNGNMKWRILIGGKRKDEGKAIARSADGGLFVLGRSKSFSKEYDYDLYLAKVSLDGKVVWTTSIGGGRDEYAAGVAGTDDGGAIVVGASESFQNGYKDIYLAKVNANGKVIYQRAFGSERDDEARAITRLKDGALMVAGYRETERAGDSDFFVMKINQHGKKLWFKSFGGKYADVIEGIAPSLEGGVYAVGTTASYGSEQTDLAVMKIDSKGDLEWFKIYGFKYYEYGHDALLVPGGVLVAGGTNTIGKGGHSAYMLLLSSKGVLQWSKIFGGEEDDAIVSLSWLSDGTIVGVGETESFSRDKMFYMIRLKPNKHP